MASCAKQGSPSGGPKDTTPPVVLRTIPSNGSTQFSGNNITIFFDEFVVLDKINEKFMISPPVTNRPEITLRGKSVVINIEEKLRDSTTYTLYFQDAIRDLNEGNILENYQFVFSTGETVDSLSLAGMVFDAFTLEVPERMLVMLHSNPSDSAPVKTIPDYISMTDKTGYFSVNNLRPGAYRVYALNDLNSNRKYEPGEELFAFAGTVAGVTTEANSPVKEEEHDHAAEEADTAVTHFHRREPDITLFASLSPRTRYYLASSSRKEARLLEYVLSRPPDTLKFSINTPGITPDVYFRESSRYGDTIRFWLKDSALYNQPTLETIVTFPLTTPGDSLTYRTDTIPMRFIQPRAPRGGTQRKTVTLVSNTTAAGIPPGRDIRILPDVPVQSVEFADFLLVEVNDSSASPLQFTPVFDSLVPREITIRHNLAEGAEYMLKILPGAVTSVYGEKNDTTTFRFRIRTRASYGTLTVRTMEYEGPVVIQLLDQREKEIAAQRIVSPGKAIFNFIENGTYRLKVIYDTNGDGTWTPGDFLRGIQPESVSFFPEEIEVKSNWDMEQDWNIGVKNQKNENLRLKKPDQPVIR